MEKKCKNPGMRVDNPNVDACLSKSYQCVNKKLQRRAASGGDENGFSEREMYEWERAKDRGEGALERFWSKMKASGRRASGQLWSEKKRAAKIRSLRKSERKLRRSVEKSAKKIDKHRMKRDKIANDIDQHDKMIPRRRINKPAVTLILEQ